MEFGQGDPYAEIVRRTEAFGVTAKTLVRMTAVGCYYGDADNQGVWTDVIDRLASVEPLGGKVILIKLQRYIPLLLMYAGGIAAIAAGKYGTLASLFTVPIREDNQEHPVLTKLYASSVLEMDVANKAFFPTQQRHTPASEWLALVLREPLREFLPREERYQRTFDEFEYLVGFKYMDLKHDDRWMPIGSWGWRDSGRKLLDNFVEACKSQGEAWAPVSQGLFASTSRFLQLEKALRENILPHLHFW
jgi:hypothetical protein